MILLRYFFLFVGIALLGCSQSQRPGAVVPDNDEIVSDTLRLTDSTFYSGGEALLLTRFTSLAQFRELVDVKYLHDLLDTNEHKSANPKVQLTYRVGERQVISVLESGISQADFIKAKKGNFWNKVSLGIKSPFAVRHQKGPRDVLKIWVGESLKSMELVMQPSMILQRSWYSIY